MQNWAIVLDEFCSESFSLENHTLIRMNDFLHDPEAIIDAAVLQKFAKITPQYPGVRAPLDPAIAQDWTALLSPMLDHAFGKAPAGWAVQAWFSIVTTPPADLIPLQCFPHVDGTDPRQLAMMLYLDRTAHGGTGFFRHLSSGLSQLTEENYPLYRDALQRDVAEHGLPEPRYTTDGSPFFERIYASSGAFNQAIFYRGNLLHSGLIDNAAPLSADPRKGRLTLNAFFRPL